MNGTLKRARYGAALAAVLCTPANAQTYVDDIGMQLQQQLAQSRIRLRAVMVESRNFWAASCRLGSPADCEVAELKNAEILLFDAENRREGADSEKDRQAREMAREARAKVSDLIDVLGRR